MTEKFNSNILLTQLYQLTSEDNPKGKDRLQISWNLSNKPKYKYHYSLCTNTWTNSIKTLQFCENKTPGNYLLCTQYSLLDVTCSIEDIDSVIWVMSCPSIQKD